MFSKIRRKLDLLYRRHILRDQFLINAARWVKDNGDHSLRLNYPLTPESVVLDLGGYHGDFAAAIHEKYGCQIYVFEPVNQFYESCVERFQANPKITCLNYGLSSADATLNIGLAENASSFESTLTQGAVELVRVRSVANCILELGISQIDLIKINIEGGEFDVLPAMIKSGDIKKVHFLQVQFHNFVHSAAAKRNEIRAQLEKSHVEMWNYEFVWESWRILSKS
jgi:FkbM family methyltransferase